MSRDKQRQNKILKIGQFSIILILVTGWWFSGWPRVWREPAIPPEI